MEWLKSLSNAIDYIESNLDGEISYEKAAEIACCSTYYFQRMFSYVAGIPLSEYIRRRRMTQAAFELQSADTRVLDVALKYGYTSPHSTGRFRAFTEFLPPPQSHREACLTRIPLLSFQSKFREAVL
jgi:AraC family transcriptional regulator